MTYWRRKEKISKIIDRIKNTKNDIAALPQKKKEKIIISVCVSILSVFMAVVIIVSAVFNHYLNKVNYGDIKQVATANSELMSQLDEEEQLDFDIVGSKPISASKDSSDDNLNEDEAEDYSDYEIIVENGESIEISNIGKEVKKKDDESIEKNISDNELWYSDDVYNLLIAGYDAGNVDNADADTPKFYRSDAIIIASINKAKKTVKLISLSRATYAAIPGHGNKRLNTAHAYGGASLLVETIEQNYKVKIDRYVTANFEGFEKIIDSLDGVSVDMTKKEASFVFNTDSLSGGKYLMNGSQALRYVRLRKTDSDRTRTGRQRKVLKAIMNKAKTMNTSEKMNFLDTVLPYVTTNLNKTDIVKKISELDTYLSWPLEQYIVPQKATQYEMRDGLEVIIVDWEETTKYIHSVIYDGTEAKTSRT